MKDRTITIEPIEYEESTRDIILSNTKPGKSYYGISFRKLLKVTDRNIFENLKNLSNEGYFKDLGIKKIQTTGRSARIFKRL